jgi:hypothetical protein
VVASELNKGEKKKEEEHERSYLQTSSFFF